MKVYIFKSAWEGDGLVFRADDFKNDQGLFQEVLGRWINMLKERYTPEERDRHQKEGFPSIQIKEMTEEEYAEYPASMDAHYIFTGRK